MTIISFSDLSEAITELTKKVDELYKIISKVQLQEAETPTFETLPKYVGEILNRVNRIESRLNIEVQEPQQEELFSEFIPKSEVRGKFASSSTLWNWEKMGKLNSYGIGGKRFYKRSELENLIQPVKK